MVSNDGGGFTKICLAWVAALSANWLADVMNRLGFGCCPWILTSQFSSSWCEYTFMMIICSMMSSIPLSNLYLLAPSWVVASSSSVFEELCESSEEELCSKSSSFSSRILNLLRLYRFTPMRCRVMLRWCVHVWHVSLPHSYRCLCCSLNWFVFGHLLVRYSIWFAME